MICLSLALTRLSHLSAADFLAHWRNVHAPLVASLAGDLGIRRYVQIHALGEETLTALGVTGAPLCDGVAQIWFDDQAAALSARSSAAGKAAFAQLRHDEANFIAREKSRLWWGEPHLVLG